MSTTLTITLSKGRILDETLPLLAAAGIVASEDPATSRKRDAMDLACLTGQRPADVLRFRLPDIRDGAL